MSDIVPVSQYYNNNEIFDGMSVPYGSVPIGEDYELEVVTADRTDSIEAFFPGAQARPSGLSHISTETEDD